MFRDNRLAIYFVFLLEALVLGIWIPRIPDIKHRLALSDSELGFCLFALAAGTILTFMFIGRHVARIGLRRACQWFLPLWALAFILPGQVTSMAGLFLALLVAGMAVGVVEIAMNAMANALEKHYQRRMMSKCHGFWSLGSMIGALSSAAVARAGIPVSTHFLWVMPVIAVLGWLASSALPAGVGGPERHQAGAPQPSLRARFARLRDGLLLLCLMPIGVMVVEGAFIDWSAVFMRDVMNAGPMIIGTTYAFFSVIMAATRLSGDYLAARHGEVRVIRISGLCAALGIGLFALAGSLPQAFVGACLSGLGTAIVYPLAVSAAANRPGSVTENVAAVSLLSFTTFLLAPPFIGWLSDLAGLRVALLVLVPLALGTALLAGEAGKTKTAN